MQNTKVLEMLISNRIDDLKQMLRDEIYADLLKKKPGASKRYSAMKKYFSYINSEREFLQKPCLVEYEGKSYTSFCNSYSVALTTEPCGVIELYTDTDRYPNTSRLIRKEGDESLIDFTKTIAKAKLEGYKLNKSEVNTYKFKYLLHYKNTYFKLGLLDATFSIIDDGEPAKVYISDGPHDPITIETSVGICTVMPMRIDDAREDHIIIEAEETDK